MDEKKEILSFTIVLHQARLDLNLSLNDYCIADCIYNLSNNPRSKIGGWCYASKEKLGALIGISGTSVYAILNKLISLKLIEKDEDTRYLRTTQLWYDTVVMKRMHLRKLSPTKESLVKTLKKVKSDTQESLDNKYIYKKKNKTVAKATSYHEEIRDLFDYYKQEFVNKISSEPPIFNWGVCEKNAKPFIRNTGLVKMKKLVDLYFNSNDELYKDNAYSLTCFLSAKTLHKLNIKQ